MPNAATDPAHGLRLDSDAADAVLVMHASPVADPVRVDVYRRFEGALFGAIPATPVTGV